MRYVVSSDRSVEQATTDLEDAVRRNGFGVLHQYDLKKTLADQFELYDLTSDPMELRNRYDDPTCSVQQAAMVEILADQRARKRLSPLSGAGLGQ